MKLSSVFSIVVGLHLLVIASLFILPGCQTKPKTKPADTTLTAPSAPRTTETAERGLHDDFNAGMGRPSSPPARVSASAGPEPLAPPTRPVRQLESGPPRMVGTAQPTAAPAPTAPSADPVLQPLPTAPTPATAVTSSYTVVAGDNLSLIARRHGVTLNELMQANDLRRDSILRVGQELVIPAPITREGPQQPVQTQIRPVDVGDDGRVHTVVSGDTLSGLASRYGSSVAAIRSANNLRNDMIRVGQELLIPSADSAPAAAPRPTAERTPAPTPAREMRPNEQGELSYEVRPGDTLGAISNRFDVPVRVIMERNAISDPRRLRAGQQLVIPTGMRPVQDTPPPVRRETPVVPAPVTPAPAPESFDFDDLENIPEVPVEESN